MKNSFWLVLIFEAYVCTSCLNYQYATISGDLKKDKNHQLVFENDTLKIMYSFIGKDCSIQINVLNKINAPIYVDWRKSALIIDERRFSYWKDESILNVTSTGYDINWTNQVSTGNSKMEGTIFRFEQISFIPPRSSIVVSPLSAKSDLFTLPKATKDQRIKVGKEGSRGLKYNFSREETPFLFRSYLTISVTEDFARPLTLDHSFWVSEIIQTTVDPLALANNSQDQFYLAEDTDFGNFMIGFIGIIVLIAIVVAN